MNDIETKLKKLADHGAVRLTATHLSAGKFTLTFTFPDPVGGAVAGERFSNLGTSLVDLVDEALIIVLALKEQKP